MKNTLPKTQMPRIPVDAGDWIFDDSLQKWIENEFISQEYYDSYPTKRNVFNNTKATFYVGGFPRQANNTLRNILLTTFPDMSMPDPLMHVVSLSEKAIVDQKIVFYTVRNPHDAILSLMSMNVKLWPDRFIFKNNKEYVLIINQYINYYIRHCSFIKNNIKNITVISFEEIIHMNDDYNVNIQNNYIIRHLAHKYNLNINSNNNPTPFSAYTTSNKEVELLNLSTFYYKKKLKKANEIYQEIIQLVSKQDFS